MIKDMKPIEPTGEIPVKVPEPDKTVIPEKPVPVEAKEFEVKNTPWYRQSGVKRSTGAILMIVGGAMSLFPSTNLLGTGIYSLGAVVGGIGVADAMRKSKPTADNPDKGLWYTILEGLKQTANAMKKK